MMMAFLSLLLAQAPAVDGNDPSASDFSHSSDFGLKAPSFVARPKDSAVLGARGDVSIGIFAPLTIAVSDRVELWAQPLLFFVAPNANARFTLFAPDEHWSFAGEAGLSLPTFGMRLLKGYLFPSWETSGNNVGWMLVPRLGLVATRRINRSDALTARIDAAFRLQLGQSSAMPTSSFLGPLEILLAAPLTGFCGHAGVAYDKLLNRWLRLRGELNLYLTGAQGDLWVDGQSVGSLAPLSPVIATAHLGLDIAVFAQSRITVGLLWANYDSGQTVLAKQADGYSERVKVRSNNFLPTVDYVWAWE